MRSTGPESNTWRIAVETPRGVEGYGVLVAVAGERWRSRIVTFPKILWMIPGGGETIKFLARTRDEVERKAIDFIRRHCVAKGYLMRDEVQYVRTPRPTAAINAGGRPVSSAGVAPRFRRYLPVRFGRTRPILLGQTDNISESGLFVSTEYSLVEGELVGLMLDLDYCKVPLRGSVAWHRSAPEPGRPQGMGLHLLRPPPIYVSYVRALV